MVIYKDLNHVGIERRDTPYKIPAPRGGILHVVSRCYVLNKFPMHLIHLQTFFFYPIFFTSSVVASNKVQIRKEKVVVVVVVVQLFCIVVVAVTSFAIHVLFIN